MAPLMAFQLMTPLLGIVLALRGHSATRQWVGTAGRRCAKSAYHHVVAINADVLMK